MAGSWGSYGHPADEETYAPPDSWSRSPNAVGLLPRVPALGTLPDQGGLLPRPATKAVLPGQDFYL